jgi:transposase-like protein
VAYAGLNRRVSTCEIPASSKRPRKRFSQEVYDSAVAEIVAAKLHGTKEYHEALAKHYAAGLSLARIAKEMGLSSANPLYYGVSRVALAKE